MLTPANPFQGSTSQLQGEPAPNFSDTHVLIVIPSASGHDSGMYVLCPRERLDDAEIALAAVSRSLQQEGKLTFENFAAAIQHYSLFPLTSHQSERPWNVLGDDILDHWSVTIPKSASHCLKGQTLSAVLMHPEVDQVVVLQDGSGAYYRSDSEVDIDPHDDTFQINAAPLGAVLLGRRQFGTNGASLERAYNTMVQSGFTVELIDD